MIRVFFLLIGLSANCLALVADDSGTQTDVLTGEPRFPQEHIDFFESEIRPVLVQFCFDCHSTDAPELKAGLSLDSRAGMLKGGDSGAAVVLGKPAESLLIASVKYEASEMPPDRKLDRRSIEASNLYRFDRHPAYLAADKQVYLCGRNEFPACRGIARR